MISFSLSPSQESKLALWLRQQDQEVCTTQREAVLQRLEQNPADPHYLARLAQLDDGIPYYGAIGGAVSYTFTPNSIGVTIKVTHASTKNTLDLSEYDSW